MKQLLITCLIFFSIIGFMSIGLILKGRALKKSCGTLSDDKEECLICDRGNAPDKCEEQS